MFNHFGEVKYTAAMAFAKAETIAKVNMVCDKICDQAICSALCGHRNCETCRIEQMRGKRIEELKRR